MLFKFKCLGCGVEYRLQHHFLRHIQYHVLRGRYDVLEDAIKQVKAKREEKKDAVNI